MMNGQRTIYFQVVFQALKSVQTKWQGKLLRCDTVDQRQERDLNQMEMLPIDVVIEATRIKSGRVGLVSSTIVSHLFTLRDHQ